MTALIALCCALLTPTLTPAQTGVVADVLQLRFHSDFWLNLHHTLYAAAWARRPEAGTPRSRAGALPAPLDDASLTPDERKAWDAAIDYYDRRLASRDLLFGEGMDAIKLALAAGDLKRRAIDDELRAALESAAPVYRRAFWPAHDRVNRAWIAATTESLRAIGTPTVARLERVYQTRWFSNPVRVDVVWVANRQGAYTTDDPVHVVVSSSDPEHVSWTSAEIVFHEVSHSLVDKIFKDLNAALGARRRDHEQLWHVVQFYLTGSVVQEVLRERGIDYTPYLYATGLFDRAWPRYRKPVEDNWKPYLDGSVSLKDAIARTLAAVTP